MGESNTIEHALQLIRDNPKKLYRLAKYMDWSTSTVYAWKNGKFSPSEENAERIVSYFNDPKPINEAPTNVSPSILERAMEIVMKRCNDLEIERDALREQLDAAREEIARLRGFDGDN